MPLTTADETYADAQAMGGASLGQGLSDYGEPLTTRPLEGDPECVHRAVAAQYINTNGGCLP